MKGTNELVRSVCIRAAHLKPTEDRRSPLQRQHLNLDYVPLACEATPRSILESEAQLAKHSELKVWVRRAPLECHHDAPGSKALASVR